VWCVVCMCARVAQQLEGSIHGNYMQLEIKYERHKGCTAN